MPQIGGHYQVDVGAAPLGAEAPTSRYPDHSQESCMSDFLRVAAVSLDCADPSKLAEFYRQLLDGKVLWASDDSVGISVPGAVLVMQRVVRYQPPTWPKSCG